MGDSGNPKCKACMAAPLSLAQGGMGSGRPSKGVLKKWMAPPDNAATRLSGDARIALNLLFLRGDPEGFFRYAS